MKSRNIRSLVITLSETTLALLRSDRPLPESRLLSLRAALGSVLGLNLSELPADDQALTLRAEVLMLAQRASTAAALGLLKLNGRSAQLTAANLGFMIDELDGQTLSLLTDTERRRLKLKLTLLLNLAMRKAAFDLNSDRRGAGTVRLETEAQLLPLLDVLDLAGLLKLETDLAAVGLPVLPGLRLNENPKLNDLRSHLLSLNDGQSLADLPHGLDLLAGNHLPDLSNELLEVGAEADAPCPLETPARR